MTHSLEVYSGDELRGLLLSVGFVGVTLAGSLHGRTPYDESARRLVALAHTAGPVPDARGPGPRTIYPAGTIQGTR